LNSQILMPRAAQAYSLPNHHAGVGNGP
jgi:hypothetical protein